MLSEPGPQESVGKWRTEQVLINQLKYTILLEQYQPVFDKYPNSKNGDYPEITAVLAIWLYALDILILIDRYISFDKPQMLAKLYLAYLDGKIIWDEFTMYAEVIDRFLLLDFRTLISVATTFHTLRDSSADIILRLAALGLMAEDKSMSVSEARKVIKGEIKSASQMSSDSKKEKYRRTNFGRKLADILR